MIHIVIPGPPVAKARARISYRSSLGKYVGVTPAKTREAEGEVGWLAREAMQGSEPMTGAVCVEMAIYYPIPKSWPKKRQEDARSKRLRPTVRPDIDNIAKLFKDAVNGILWKDDSQVVDLHVRKWYSDSPRTEVKVYSEEVEYARQKEILKDIRAEMEDYMTAEEWYKESGKWNPS